MRKALILLVQVPLIALVYGACGGDDSATDDAGADAASDVRIDKKAPPDTGVQDSGGACSPTDNSGSFTPKWTPPRQPNPSACSDQQIADYFAFCYDPNTSNTTKCSQFTSQSPNKACVSCISSKQTDAAYGVLISTGGVAYANVAGCIALLTGDTSDTGCGAKEWASTDCVDDACKANCPVTDQASFQLYDQCTKQAGAASCKQYADAQCDLSDAGSVYDICVNHQAFADYYTAIAPVFCGGYSADAGPPDGGSDASGDASDDASDAASE